MRRIATIQVRGRQATFDGETFRSSSRSLARLLNQELAAMKFGPVLNTQAGVYRPDEVNDVARDIATAYGGTVIAEAPPIDYSQYPENAIF